tara:strand:+ start:3198 stop:3698 length:501 start_codon:yes stop_codon:yes gene_type:complete
MKVRDYAIKCHADTNHLYDGRPYFVHLAKVVGFAERFIHLVPPPVHVDIYDACWCHDLIEDTRQTYNDVKSKTSLMVAEIVYALTNEKGKNRKERANDKYYKGIRETPYAVFVKVCDRLANFQYSIDSQSSMAKKYKQENDEFIKNLFVPDYQEMFDMLISMKDKV